MVRQGSNAGATRASNSLCGSFSAELSQGRNPEELLELEPEDVVNKFGGSPEGEKHSVTLTITGGRQ